MSGKIFRNLVHMGRKAGRVRFQTTSAATKGIVKDDPSLWVKSPYPDIETVVGVEVHELLSERISKWGDMPAMECGVSGKKLSYRDIYRNAKGFGAALIQAGLKPGDTVGVVLPNIPEFPVVMLGCWSAGLIVSCVNPAYTSEEIKRQLKSSEAQVAITIPHFLDAVKSAKATSNSLLKSIIVIGETTEGCHTFSEMIKCDFTGVEFSSGAKRNTLETIAMLPYSSGTTAKQRLLGLAKSIWPPKGVLLSHSNITTNTMQFLQDDIGPSKSYDELQEQERLIGILPFFHSYGSAAIMLMGMYQGSNTVCLPRFEPKMFTDVVKSHRPTVMHLVTPLISYMVNSDDFTKKDFETVHTIVGAAAPIGPVLINKLIEKAEKYMFFAEGYGMTELSPLSHLLNPSLKHTKIGSCGRCVPSTWSKIIDIKTGETLGPNKRGELLVKGPQVMKGYFKNDEATKNTIDSEGWLHTGDIAYYDEDSCFYIVDRLKELIKVKGFQVAPSELEDILREHESIEDVAVIGVSDEESGEAPRAYIVPKNQNLTEDDVHEYLKPLVATFKRLKGGIEFRKSIPKAPSGKILRRELVEEYRKIHGQ